MRRALLGLALLVSGSISMALLALLSPLLVMANRPTRERVASTLLGREWIDHDDPGVDVDMIDEERDTW